MNRAAKIARISAEKSGSDFVSVFSLFAIHTVTVVKGLVIGL